MQKEKIKILHLINSLGCGGIQRQLSVVVNNLPKDSYENHIIALDSDTFFKDNIIGGCKSVTFINRSWHFPLSALITIIKSVNRIKPDILHFWNVYTIPFGLILKVLYGSKIKFLNNAIRDALTHIPFKKKIISYTYNIFDLTVANSIAGLKTYNKKGQVIYNGFDFRRIPKITQEEARHDIGFLRRDFIVTMIAELTHFKDHITFIKAAKETVFFEKNIKFYIIGDGPNRDMLEKLVKILNIENNVKFMGRIKDVETILLASDISVLTSTYGEGISNSIIESLACRTPVIATSGGAIAEIIEDKKSGFIIPIGDSYELSKKIIMLKNNKNLLKYLSDSGRKTIENKFSVDKMIKKCMKIYVYILQR